MKRTLIALAFLSSPAFAEELSPEDKLAQAQSAITMLQQQRNSAMDQAVQVGMTLDLANRKIADLTKQIEAAKAPKDAPK